MERLYLLQRECQRRDDYMSIPGYANEGIVEGIVKCIEIVSQRAKMYTPVCIILPGPMR